MGASVRQTSESQHPMIMPCPYLDIKKFVFQDAREPVSTALHKAAGHYLGVLLRLCSAVIAVAFICVELAVSSHTDMTSNTSCTTSNFALYHAYARIQPNVSLTGTIRPNLYLFKSKLEPPPLYDHGSATNTVLATYVLNS